MYCIWRKRPRLGILNIIRNAEYDPNKRVRDFKRGNKLYELTNHLGNVLLTITDKKIPVTASPNDEIINYFTADVVTANDYYPGGMLMPGRKYQASAISKYRYSINGQEKSDELNENLTTALYWEYDSRIGRRWNVDPRPNTAESPYLCFSGNPIFNSDRLGDTLRGVNEVNAKRAKESIQEIASRSTKNCEKIMQYFKVGSDKVTYEKIDKSSINNTIKELGLSESQSTLINGYVEAINSTTTHFIQIKNPGEKNDLTNAKYLKIGSRKLFEGLTGGDGLVNAGDKSNGVPRQTYSSIDYSTNLNTAERLTHVLIGHNLAASYFYGVFGERVDRAKVFKFSALSSTQVNNIFYRAMNIKKEDDGSNHNREDKVGAPPGSPVDPQIRNSIPTYLKN